MSSKHYGYETRFRTEDELNEQLRGLLEITKVLTKYGVDYFLSAGTFLGAIREKDFIKWDWNVSVVCLAEQFDVKYKLLRRNFVKRGYEIEDREKMGYVSINIYKNDVKYVIESLKLNGKWRELPLHRIPAKFFIKSEKATIRGHEFNVHCNPKKILKWYYGNDWMIPKIVTNRNECMTGNSRKNKNEYKAVKSNGASQI
jgi:hypothetical protein